MNDYATDIDRAHYSREELDAALDDFTNRTGIEAWIERGEIRVPGGYSFDWPSELEEYGSAVLALRDKEAENA